MVFQSSSSSIFPPPTTTPQSGNTGNQRLYSPGQTESIYDDALENIQDFTQSYNVMLERTREDAMGLFNDAQAQTRSMINRIASRRSPAIPRMEEALASYKTEVESATSAMRTAVEKQAEFQNLQIEGAARAGRLGSNVFAIARESARLSGQVIGETLGRIGEIQMQGAEMAAELGAQTANFMQRDHETRISAMVNLIGSEVQMSMNYAGILADLSGQSTQFLSTMAQLSTGLSQQRMQGITGWNQVVASLQNARGQQETQYAVGTLGAIADIQTAQIAAETQLTVSREEREHEAAMAESGYDFVGELVEESENEESENGGA